MEGVPLRPTLNSDGEEIARYKGVPFIFFLFIFLILAFIFLFFLNLTSEYR